MDKKTAKKYCLEKAKERACKESFNAAPFEAPLSHLMELRRNGYEMHWENNCFTHAACPVFRIIKTYNSKGNIAVKITEF